MASLPEDASDDSGSYQPRFRQAHSYDHTPPGWCASRPVSTLPRRLSGLRRALAPFTLASRENRDWPHPPDSGTYGPSISSSSSRRHALWRSRANHCLAAEHYPQGSARGSGTWTATFFTPPELEFVHPISGKAESRSEKSSSTEQLDSFLESLSGVQRIKPLAPEVGHRPYERDN